MHEDIFRKEALDFRRKKHTISPVIIPSASKGIIAGGLMCLAMVSVILSLPYTERVSAQGVVMPGGGVINVRTESAGVIDNLGISPGDYVHKGQMIFSVSASKRNEGGVTAGIVNIDALRHQQKILTEDYELQKQSVLASLDNLEQLLANKKRSVEILKQKTQVFRRELQRETPFYNRVMKTPTGYAISDMEKNNIAGNHFSLNVQALNNDKLLNDEARDILLLFQKKADIDSSFNQKRFSFEKQNDEIARQINDLSLSQKYFIRSPVNGYISGLTHGNGDSVSDHESIVSITSDNSHIIVYLFLDSTAIARIHPGDRVHLKYDSYPYQDYGIYDGTILTTGKYPMTSAEILSSYGLTYPSSRYRITVELKHDFVSRNGQTYAVPAGSHVHTDILLESKSIIKWLIEPVIKRVKG
ncbi:HlyD family efflux transporter periplasmic adaptor subunit [Salmonella enterica subsp. enterica serovar Hvittingfoss]|nr:HlyD family efflux transporter periplasmic adaptor subunit [Salmonella enterica subsp. enterica serovar Hvittingfoss]